MPHFGIGPFQYMLVALTESLVPVFGQSTRSECEFLDFEAISIRFNQREAGLRDRGGGCSPTSVIQGNPLKWSFPAALAQSVQLESSSEEEGDRSHRPAAVHRCPAYILGR